MPNLPNFRRQAMGDVVPAMLEPGEFVINRKAVNALGVDNLEVLNDAGGAHSAIDKLIASATVASSLQNARPPHYQEGGQVYQGPPYEPSEADFGRQVNPFTGEEMNIAEDKKRMALQMLKSLGVGKGQRIDSDAMDSLMGMSDDRRIIPPLPPDEYVMRQENGEMYMSKQQVPKLSPAYMASFGMETPLSKRQRSLLQRRAINPESISPQLHGLLGKVLLQRLENEPE